MRFISFFVSLVICPVLLAAEGKPVSTRQVPESVKSAAAKSIPDSLKHEFRILDNGNYLGRAVSGKAGKSVELSPDGTVVRVLEEVDTLPAEVRKRFEAAAREQDLSAKPRGWQRVVEPATQRTYFQTLLSEKRSVYEVRVESDASAATISRIETRLDNGSGTRVRVSRGGGIVK